MVTALSAPDDASGAAWPERWTDVAEGEVARYTARVRAVNDGLWANGAAAALD